MSTDAGGINSFFHVLIFYEEINEAEIEREDFDLVDRVLRKQQEKEASKKRKRAEQRRLSRQGTGPGDTPNLGLKTPMQEASGELTPIADSKSPDTPDTDDKLHMDSHTPDGVAPMFKNERDNITKRATRLNKRPILTADALAK
jgi:hypothetical protein